MICFSLMSIFFVGIFSFALEGICTPFRIVNMTFKHSVDLGKDIHGVSTAVELSESARSW